MPPTPVQEAPVGFENSTRHNFRDIPSVAYSAGGIVTRELPKVGLLSGIWLSVEGVFTMTDASSLSPTKSDFAPFNLIKRLRVYANNGTDIINTTGWGLYMDNLTSTFNYRLGQTGDAQVYNFDATSSSGGTVNTLKFNLYIPCRLNDRDPLGLLLLQHPSTQLTLEITWADLMANAGYYGLYTNATSIDSFSAISINAYPTCEFFAVPADARNLPPIDYIIQTLEDQFSVAAVGEQVVNIPQGNTYIKLAAWHYHNGVLAPSSDIDRYEVRYNQTEVPYTVRANTLRAINRSMYGLDLPKGHFVLDFNHQGLPNLGTARDYVNSQYLTDFQVRPNIIATATLGTGPMIYLLRKQIVKLAA